MVGHIRGNPDVLAAARPGFSQDHPEMRRNEPVTEDVGRFYWFGRITGNHHRGGGKARKVDILRGSNFLLRGDFLREVGFETDLRGKGAQVNWELALALQARQRGAKFIYDPEVEIIHHVGPRFDSDNIHRGGFDFAGTADIAYNETFVLLKHGRGLFRVTGNLWQLLVGSAVCPGLLHVFRQLLSNRSHLLSRFVATMRGRLEAAKFCLWLIALLPSGFEVSQKQSDIRGNVMPYETRDGYAIGSSSRRSRGSTRSIPSHQEQAKFVIPLLILLEDGELRHVCEDMGAEVEVVQSGRLREPWKQCCGFTDQRLLKKHRIEMVLGWMTKAHIYSGLAVSLADCPQFIFRWASRDNGAVDRLSRKVPAAGALGCSDFVAREQQAAFPTRVLGVPVGADTNRFEAARITLLRIDASWGWKRRVPSWGLSHDCNAGRESTFMRRRCPRLQGNSDCQGVIVGGMHDLEPEYDRGLHDRIKALGMAEKIQMVGVQRNVPEWMQAMDVVVHASEREPFGIVVVEAMALGKPVVATRPGGPEEIITHDSDGQLVTWNRPDELAEAILKYLRDPEWARSVGQRAKQRSGEYTMEKYAQRVGNALRELLKSKEPASLKLKRIVTALIGVYCVRKALEEFSLMDWIIAGIIVAIAAALAAQRSSYLVDYLVIVFVFNRGLRRVLDYYAGSFNPFSPVSLTPLLVTGLMLIPFLQGFGTLPKVHKTIFYCLFVAIGYAFIVGFFRIQFAAVYALAEVLSPIAVFGYILTLSPTQNTKDRWLRTSAWCAIMASGYGWYQYFTIPPWDAFWVRAVGFEGYLGILEPTKMAVFSTMAERGVLGGFLGFAVVPMILSVEVAAPQLVWGGPCVVGDSSRRDANRADSRGIFNHGLCDGQSGNGILATGARPHRRRWCSLFRHGSQCRVPRQFRIAFRHSVTCKKMGPLEARRAIYQDSLGAILTNPFGLGLGSTGLSGRVNVGDTGNWSVIGDAGYSEIVFQFGWLGAPLIIYALWRMWKEMGRRYRMGYRPTELMLGQGIYDRFDSGLFRLEYHHSIFDSLDCVRRGAGPESIPDFCRQAANDPGCEVPSENRNRRRFSELKSFIESPPKIRTGAQWCSES